MKTRESSFGKAFLSKKRFVLVGIAACAISLLLTSPVLANEYDYVLDIYGNANEDDTIDMHDFTYTARIILWLEDETTLADANYDGEVNVLDMTQIGLIILGRESELTVIDGADRTVTLNMPIDRIASSSMPQDIRTIIALGAADKIVGVPDVIIDEADRFPAIYMPCPELLELPIAGSPYFGGPYLEVIASLEPDLVLVSYADAEPHIARMVIGGDNRFLIPASGLVGAVLLVGADIVAMQIIAPAILPVGVLTAFMGVPLFIYLIIRRRREYW